MSSIFPMQCDELRDPAELFRNALIPSPSVAGQRVSQTFHMHKTCGLGAGTHGNILNVHTWVFQRVTPHHTAPHRTTPHTHTTTTTATATHTTTNQLAAQCAPKRENSPGPDTVRIDRLKALSSFSLWWSMTVLCRWSDLSGMETSAC